MTAHTEVIGFKSDRPPKVVVHRYGQEGGAIFDPRVGKLAANRVQRS